MSYRYMRILVMFDLPVGTESERKNYRLFRKYLIKSGFLMLQESVYCKMMTSPSMEKSMKNMVHNNKPPKGLIQTITITEKQFVKMDYIVGEYTSDIIDSEERLIIL